TGMCDGRGACALHGKDVACGPQVCGRGVVTEATCNGKGVCTQVAISCEPYNCASPTQCGKGPCASDSDCADGYWCGAAQTCVPVGCDGDHVINHADHTRTD